MINWGDVASVRQGGQMPSLNFESSYGPECTIYFTAVLCSFFKSKRALTNPKIIQVDISANI